MKVRFVIIIQCRTSMNRCSGYSCVKSFYEKTGKFTDYPEIRYLSFDCGGCNGKGISARLQHIEKVFKRDQIESDNVVIHFSTCITHDNTHHDRCSNIGVMKRIVSKRGFNNVVDGTVVNQLAEKCRIEGVYKQY